MRLTPFLALLPAIAAASEQIPLGDSVKGWFDKAKTFVSSAASPAPVERIAEVIADSRVNQLNRSNWQSVLAPTSKPQDWMIFITGSNKTCFGRCERAEKAFNESVLSFATDRTSPNLGYVNCERDPILCSIWGAGAPTIWHLHRPAAVAGEPLGPSPLRVAYLNWTTVTPEEVYKIHADKIYLNKEPYDGVLHPFDGWLAQYGLNVPLGYVMWGFGAIPSWLFMIVISFMSRRIMGRRLQNPAATAGREGSAGAPAPAQ